MEIDAGIVAGDKANTGQDFPVFLRTTGDNSGKRDQTVMSSTGRDICMVGIEVKGFDSTDSFIRMIRSDVRKKEALHVMQADGKAIVSRQDAKKARKAAKEAESNGDHEKAQEQEKKAQRKERASKKEKEVAEFKRAAAKERRRLAKSGHGYNKNNEPFYKKLMKIGKNKQNHAVLVTQLKRNGKQK